MKAEIANSLKRKWKKLRFNLSASNHPIFSFYYSHLYNPKKGSLAEFISEYSRSKEGNFHVIQIGANDGITNDPIEVAI